MGNKEIDSQLKEGMAWALEFLKQNPYCLLCREDTSSKDKGIMGIFIPGREEMDVMGVPENKERIIPYLLCQKCFSKENKSKLIEEKIYQTCFSELQNLKLFHKDFGELQPDNNIEKRIKRYKKRRNKSR